MKARIVKAGKWIACGLTLLAGLAGLALGAEVLVSKKPDLPQGEICRSARS